MEYALFLIGVSLFIAVAIGVMVMLWNDNKAELKKLDEDEMKRQSKNESSNRSGFH